MKLIRSAVNGGPLGIRDLLTLGAPVERKLIRLVEERAGVRPGVSPGASLMMVYGAVKKIDSELIKFFLNGNSESKFEAKGVVYAPMNRAARRTLFNALEII